LILYWTQDICNNKFKIADNQMISWSLKKSYRSILFLLLTYYAGITLCVYVFHNDHEDPVRFHDDCIACNWEMLFQDPSLENTIAELKQQTVYIFIGYAIIEDSHFHLQQFYSTNLSVRGPPSV